MFLNNTQLVHLDHCCFLKWFWCLELHFILSHLLWENTHPAGLLKNKRKTDHQPGHTNKAKLSLQSFGRDSRQHKDDLYTLQGTVTEANQLTWKPSKLFKLLFILTITSSMYMMAVVHFVELFLKIHSYQQLKKN